MDKQTDRLSGNYCAQCKMEIKTGSFNYLVFQQGQEKEQQGVSLYFSTFLYINRLRWMYMDKMDQSKHICYATNKDN